MIQKMGRVTERDVIAALMDYVMDDLKHHCAVPNSTVIFRGESDLLSVTSAGLYHEWEVKLSHADFVRDFRSKKMKHRDLDRDNGAHWMPCYFWFVIHGFEVDMETFPPYAGLVTFDPDGRDGQGGITLERPAPRMTGRRVNGRAVGWDHKTIARLLSFRLRNELNRQRRRS